MSDPFAISLTIARQASLSMGFPRQEYWSGLPFPSPGDLPDPGIEPMSLALAGRFFNMSHQGSQFGVDYIVFVFGPGLTPAIATFSCHATLHPLTGNLALPSGWGRNAWAAEGLHQETRARPPGTWAPCTKAPCVCWSLSHGRLLATPWTIACQGPFPLGFSRQEYWSGLPFSSPGESSWPRNQTLVSHIGGIFCTFWATREASKAQKRPKSQGGGGTGTGSPFAPWCREGCIWVAGEVWVLQKPGGWGQVWGVGTVGLWAQAETWAWRVQVLRGIHVQHTAHQAHRPCQVLGVHASPRCICWALQAWSNYSPGLLGLIDAFQLTIERSAPSFKFFSFSFLHWLCGILEFLTPGKHHSGIPDRRGLVFS